MNLFYRLLILVQLLLAFLSRDQNQIAYLRYLWSSYFSEHEASLGNPNENSISASNYKETKSDVTNYEYSLFLER
jgi:hypothetical protein